MYTIFINDKPFIITENRDHLVNNFTYQHFYNEEAIGIKKITEEFLNNKKNAGLVLHVNDTLKSFELFSKNFQVIEAAGGVIENELNQILLIFRQGKWDLPKGKIEQEETETQAAKREVMEECGIVDVEVGEKLTTTYHTYFMSKKHFLKISHWYLMSCLSKEKLRPQVEEDISEIKWFDKQSLNLNILDTYKSIFTVLELYLNRKDK